ncbi:CRISPR-associated DxTHG motif protein [Infirmifilum lucidum]|uniref:CRISPR-associated DxTHG motif protein n=1 Tax=Infirmifilum lucidum TaxID=2776706 RepID=A0A7L9FJ32_9CREN|nr:CRISPR-associated DxTHG motif protein [Infirmifilum lucidum]QOJ78805.1 CRISPR-associated DxTHG motif protein [Infirmifilum lucidum]
MIVVATLGDVLGYREATYRFGEKSFRGFLSLGCFKGASAYVVVALESVLRSVREVGHALPRHLEGLVGRECLGHVEARLEEGATGGAGRGERRVRVEVSPRNIGGYRDWVGGVEEYYEFFLREALGGLGGAALRVVVLPARADNWYGYAYRVSNRDVYLAILLGELYRVLRERGGGEGVEVVLDVTHGLNFVVPLVFEALRLLAPLFKAKVRVYNAVPVKSDVGEFEVVETYKVNGDRSKLDLSFVEESRIGGSTLRSLYRALVLNAPLALYYLCECGREEVDAYGDFVAGRRVAGNVLEGGDERASTARVMAWVLADWACRRVGSNRLEDMMEWAPGIYGALGDAPRRIVENELNNLYRLSERLAPGEEKPLYELMGVEPERPWERGGELERNFVAHAGLLKELVVLGRDRDGAYVKYRPGEALCKTMEALGIDMSCACFKCGERH